MKRRSSIAVLAAGLLVIALARLTTSVGSPPLFDGVVVQDTYRYLEPGPGQAGAPTSFLKTVPVPQSPGLLFAAATSESPPQAQLIAPEGSFAVPPGAVSLNVSIEPVSSSVTPAFGRLSGNVYRFAVTDSTGAPVRVSSDAVPSLVLRAPDGTATATIDRLEGTTWQQLPTEPAGQPGIFLTNITELGDFSLIEPKQSLLGLDPTLLIIGGGTAVVSALIIGAVLYRSRRPQLARSPTPSRGKPVASKRRRGGPRRGRRR